MRSVLGDEASSGIKEMLHAVAETEGQVWLLLDGLDEVAPAELQTARERIQGLARSLGAVRMAVCSRPIGYQDLGTLFRTAHLQPLPGPKRLELLERWLGPTKGRSAWDRLGTRPKLLELSGNPLMLTLVASIADSREDLPSGRLGLYGEALDLLLTRGHGAEQIPVKDAQSARVLLRVLALKLQESNAEQWSFEQLDELLFECLREEQALAVRLAAWDGSATKFLDDVAKNAGLLGPETGGKQDLWRFLHRQLREFLAAEELRRGGLNACEAKFKELKEDEKQIPRWSETLGFTCGMQEEPLILLAALRDASSQAALRVLPEIEGVEPAAMLAFLQETDGWDGDDLRRLVLGWKGSLGIELESVGELLYAQVAEDLETERLAFYYYGLETLLGKKIDRQRFFEACGRWKPDEVPELPFVRIEGDTFTMGSPEDEAERDDDEGPQREVAVRTFELSAMAVTNAQYQVFDPEHEAQEWGDEVSAAELCDHPVVNVSWWEAYLFCGWLGKDVRLPSEAQWEFACRAGESGPFSFGENVTPEQVNFHGSYPYARAAKGRFRARTVEVGSLPANKWGLHEMHGNVDEWCQDYWHGSYEGAFKDDDPRDEGVSSARVVRGGSWYNFARLCRSGARYWIDPDDRYDDLGFRPARVTP